MHRLSDHYGRNVIRREILRQPAFQPFGFDGFEPSGNDPQGIAHGDSRALRSIIYGQNTSHDLTLSNSSNNTGPHTLTDIPDTKHTVLAVRHTARNPHTALSDIQFLEEAAQRALRIDQSEEGIDRHALLLHRIAVAHRHGIILEVWPSTVTHSGVPIASCRR